MNVVVDINYSAVGHRSVTNFRGVGEVVQLNECRSSKYSGIIDLSIDTSVRFGISSKQCSHNRISSSSISSSQPSFHLVKSCSSFLAGSTTGAINPSGSEIELDTDRIPLLVLGFSFKAALKVNLSSLASHNNPRYLDLSRQEIWIFLFL